MKRFYIIDYIDIDGEQNLKQIFVEPEEAKALFQEMINNGIEGKIIDLTQDDQRNESDSASFEKMLMDSNPSHVN
jgi:hypothetical protein